MLALSKLQGVTGTGEERAQDRWKKSTSRVGEPSSGEAVSEAKGSARSVPTCLSEPLSPAVRHRTVRQG